MATTDMNDMYKAPPMIPALEKAYGKASIPVPMVPCKRTTVCTVLISLRKRHDHFSAKEKVSKMLGINVKKLTPTWKSNTSKQTNKPISHEITKILSIFAVYFVIFKIRKKVDILSTESERKQYQMNENENRNKGGRRKEPILNETKSPILETEQNRRFRKWDKTADFENETKPPILQKRTNCYQNCFTDKSVLD